MDDGGESGGNLEKGLVRCIVLVILYVMQCYFRDRCVMYR